MTLNLVILGLPGAGKGTQAQKLSERYGIPHISMGDILRANKDYETDSGKTVGEIIDAGNPVSEDTAGDLLAKRLDQPDCSDGFVLDGFPRYEEQADVMDEIADIDLMLIIDVAVDEIYERLTNRRICPDCGDHYHLVYDPPEDDGRCDECGTALVQREDDTEERIAERIDWQRDGLEEVLDHYDGSDTPDIAIEHIDGNQSIADVWTDVQAVVEQYA